MMLSHISERPISVLIVGDYHDIGNFINCFDIAGLDYISNIPSLGAQWHEMRELMVKTNAIESNGKMFSITCAYENNEELLAKAKQAEAIIHIQPSTEEKKKFYDFDNIIEENNTIFCLNLPDNWKISPADCLDKIAENAQKIMNESFSTHKTLLIGQQDLNSPLNALPTELIFLISQTFFQLKKNKAVESQPVSNYQSQSEEEKSPWALDFSCFQQ